LASAGDYGDSFVELTPDSSIQPTNKNGYGLSVTDYFTPFNEQSLSDNDTDLGSAGPLLLPDQPGAHPHEMVGAGKGLTMYLLDRGSMGGHNTSNDLNAVQTVSVNRAPGSQDFDFWKCPAGLRDNQHHAHGECPERKPKISCFHVFRS
jgi:hypothetical protein